ncbi:hypothetical protein K1T71_006922 [Dendrolimus kikuchii]|uniref:Uncharacterized protein n=1 Tax=Dendrolimus kikuchii TaxID=765133 RepID=A0ACC1CZ40_9NEOP|nr:hypothetical protein K1T71_006922 [Dendrolimus kikuchii]
MQAAVAVSFILNYQKAFMNLRGVELTTHKYPEQATVNDSVAFDYIIVGGGTAGIVIASRLAQVKGNRVLLVEAGGNPPIESNIPSTLIYLEKSQKDWKFPVENDNVNQKCSKSQKFGLQGKMLGGTSCLNYLHYEQGSYKDYDRWAEIVGDPSWNFTNIQPYIKKSENFEDSDISNSTERTNFGKGGPVTITKESHCEVNDYLSAFGELGYKVVPELSAANPTGYAPQLYNIGNYKRQCTAENYLYKAKDWPNLFVLKNALVTKIIFDKNNNAVAVEMRTENRVNRVDARKEVIICAGAINSPKLLMLSGIGPKEHLKKLNINVIQDLPVGKNLQDRAGVLLVYDMRKLSTSPVSPNIGVYPAYVFTGQVSENPHSPDYKTLHYVNYPMNFVFYCTFTYDYSDEVCDRLFGTNADNQFLFTFVSTLKPKSRGEVMLRSRDYSDPPLIYPKYLSNKEDIEGLVKNVMNFLKINETKFFKNADAVFVDPKLKTCKHLKFGSFEYWECFVRCMATAERSYCGTSAMGSVVDSRLRVKGVKRLRVADSSVMPEITSGATLSPTLTIAEKAADMIKEDYNYVDDDGREIGPENEKCEKESHC